MWKEVFSHVAVMQCVYENSSKPTIILTRFSLVKKTVGRETVKFTIKNDFMTLRTINRSCCNHIDGIITVKDIGSKAWKEVIRKKALSTQIFVIHVSCEELFAQKM